MAKAVQGKIRVPVKVLCIHPDEPDGKRLVGMRYIRAVEAHALEFKCPKCRKEVIVEVGIAG